ncbi:MAG TPA: hypothetical protein VK831_05500 [Candidatus Deferrimicrobiaceae bacterium]|nr:hypothetical protein [Candidatus Deferrimicrobiaceae bacterium]
MDASRNADLVEMARDAAIERSDFLVRAGEQLERFMAANADRIRDLGGLVLIDDDPDYLAVSPDGTFRSRSRVYDESSGEWVSETEVIETAGELVELYNPADILQAFADAESADAGLEEDEIAAGADDEDEDAIDAGEADGADLYAGAADTWAAGQPEVPAVTDEASAALALYELALDFQDRSQRTEAGLIEQFETASSVLLGQVGTLVVVDDDDEHLALGVGGFRGRVIPEGQSDWQDISGPEEIVRYYDPTDVFGDLAEAIAEAYPTVAEGDGEDGDGGDDADEAGEADRP